MAAASRPLVDRLRGVLDPLPEVPEAAVDPATGERRSAVLLLADGGAAGVPLLFIRRSHRVSSHRGQVAFPGGGVEPGDAGPAETALREASEEMGVDSRSVEVLGMLTPLTTATSGRFLDPVVGLRRGPLALRADSFEVAEHFWVPLTKLLAAPLTLRPIPGRAGGRPVAFLDLGDRIVWGATAALLVDLRERLERG